jgi:hypothetical protein
MDSILETKETNYVDGSNLKNLNSITTNMAKYFTYKYDNVIVADTKILIINFNNTIDIRYMDDRYSPGNISASINIFIARNYDPIEQIRNLFTPQVNNLINANQPLEAVDIFKINHNKIQSYQNIQFIIYNTEYVKYISFNNQNNSHHANIIIYDKINNSFELFEPDEQYSEEENNIIETSLRQHIEFDKFYPPTTFCPQPPFQVKDEEEKNKNMFEGYYGGFCFSWSMWYIDLRLSNINKSRNEILESAHRTLNATNSFHKFIGNYTAFILTLDSNLQKASDLETSSAILNTILRFFKLIKQQILISKEGINSSIESVVLEKLITNLDKVHLEYMYNLLLIELDKEKDNTFEVYSNNISFRSALIQIINEDLSDVQITNIYRKFINKFYDNKYSDDVVKENCPNDMRYINALNDQIWKIKGGKRRLRNKADKCLYFKANCINFLPANINIYTMLLLMLPDLEIDENVGYFGSIERERLKYSEENFNQLLNKIASIL